MSVVFDIISVFQSIFIVFPELFCVISLIVLLIYGLLIPVVSNSGVIGANYSVCFSWLVLFSIIIFLGLSIPNLGLGNDMYLFGNEYFTNNIFTVWKVLFSFYFVFVLSLEYQRHGNLAALFNDLSFQLCFVLFSCARSNKK